MTSMTLNTIQAGNPHALGAMHASRDTAERVRRAVYVISERVTPEGSRSFWTKVGAAFENRDGSLTIKLDALPLSGTLQVRDEDKDRERRERQAQAPF